MPKEYTSEIHQLLKLGGTPSESSGAQTASIPGLPISDSVHEEIIYPDDDETTTKKITTSFHGDSHGVASSADPAKTSLIVKQAIIYPLVFLAAFAFFYFLLNFSSIVSQVGGWFAKPQAEEILGEDLTAYYNWIGAYYFSVNDSKVLDPNNDIDKDGLSNHDEFVMHTNPVNADSDADGAFDGLELLAGTNMWGIGPAPMGQNKLAELLDPSLVNNRISYNTAAGVSSGVVSGASVIQYDLTKPGRLSIPHLNLQVPLVWSSDPSEFDKDLSRGVVHYPGTAMPGEQGTIYVSGHSSDYIWKRNQFAQIFSKLNVLQAGDDVFVDVYDVSGNTHTFRYQVTVKKVYSPNDQAQFIDNTANKINLSTCWPIGTTKDRLVVTAVEVAL